MFNLQDESVSFLKTLFEKIQIYNLDVKNWEIDHLCYRVSTSNEYIEMKKIFKNHGEYLSEEQVGGRFISTYKLNRPLYFKNYIIDLLELPAPKEENGYAKGFEHAEFVIDENFDSLIKKYPQIPFEKKGISKNINPELGVRFEKNLSLKFHYKSLEHIINIEKNLYIKQFLEETCFFKNFHEFSPCLSGTIPLDIHLENSDLDILCYGDLSLIEKKSSLLFKNYENFSFSYSIQQGLKSLQVNFIYKQLEVEIFAQSTPSQEQNANLHFLIEGRLLKIFGENLRQKIIELKQAGLKTEPAFGQIFQLDEPYEDLKKIQKMDDMALKKRFRTFIEAL